MPDLATVLQIASGIGASSAPPGASTMTVPPAASVVPVAQPSSTPMFAPVIDVGGTPGAPPGQPGSELAHTIVSSAGSAQAAPTTAAVPNAPLSPVAAAGAPSTASIPTMVVTAPSIAFNHQWRDPALGAKMQAAEQALTASNSGTSAPAGAGNATSSSSAPVSGASSSNGYTTFGGLASNIAAGVNQGALDTIGMPVDAATWLLNLVPRGINAAAGTHIPTIQNPIGGTTWLENVGGAIGADPRTIQPANSVEAAARAGGQALGSMAVPGLGAMGAPLAGMSGAVQAALAEGAKPASLALGFASGVGGQAAADQVPEPYKPLANFLGQLGVGGAAVLGGGIGRMGAAAGEHLAAPLSIGQRATPIVNPETGQPFTEAATGEPIMATPWQRQTAGASIAHAAEQEPTALAASLPTQAPLVPGVQHTMGTVTGNTRLLGEERRLQATPYGRAAFAETAARNNLARLSALRNLEPEEAAEGARQWVLSTLRRIQEGAVQRTSAATTRAAEAIERNGLGLGLQSPNEAGEAARTTLESMRAPVKAQIQRAFQSFDPDGKLAVNADAIGQEAKRIIAEEVRRGDALEGIERGPLEEAAKISGVTTVHDITDLLGVVQDRLRRIARNRELGRESLPFRRMSMLADTISGTLADAAARAAGEDVASGVPAGGRIIDRVSQGIPVNRGEAANGPGTAAAGRDGSGTNPVVGGTAAAGEANGGADGGGTSNAAPNEGPAGPGYPGSNPGLALPASNEVAGDVAHPGLSDQLEADVAAWLQARAPQSQTAQATAAAPLKENFPATEAARMRANRRDWALYKATYRDGVVGDILRDRRPGEFATASAQVPGMVWRPGLKGLAVADELIRKFGPDTTQKILGDYPALTLRNAAFKSGVWNNAAFEAWRRTYGPLLDKFPALKARFDDAADAQAAAETAAILGREHVQQFESSAAGAYLSKDGLGLEPQAAISNLLRMPNAPQAAKNLVGQMRGDEAAIAGLRRNYIDYLLQQTRSSAEAATSGEKEISSAKLQKLITDPKVSAVGRAILRPDQWKSVQAIGRDLELADRQWNAVKIKGSPGTAADLIARFKAMGRPISHLLPIIIADNLGEAIATHGLHLPGIAGVATGVGISAGALLMQEARAAGFATAEQLQVEAMLNPALGRVLLQDAVLNPRASALRKTARRLFSLSLGSAVSSVIHQNGGH